LDRPAALSELWAAKRSLSALWKRQQSQFYRATMERDKNLNFYYLKLRELDFQSCLKLH
jgi:hypothetical protein